MMTVWSIVMTGLVAPRRAASMANAARRPAILAMIATIRSRRITAAPIAEFSPIAGAGPWPARCVQDAVSGAEKLPQRSSTAVNTPGPAGPRPPTNLTYNL